MSRDARDLVAALAALLGNSERILVFTGAGVSTGSGIPDFRGPRGLWTTRRPVYFRDFLSSEAARIEHWDYKLEGWEAFRNARPNAAHIALAELAAMGKVAAIVTQNIDGLHQAAHPQNIFSPGSTEIIELHGTNRLVECLGCGRRSEPDPAFAQFKLTRRCPRCACGGLLKTATVSFGQPLPPEVLERAFRAADRADMVLAAGSTLSVDPAASVPLRAARRGAPYAVVNQGPTEHDALATLRLEGDAAEILPAAVRGLAVRQRPKSVGR